MRHLQMPNDPATQLSTSRLLRTTLLLGALLASACSGSHRTKEVSIEGYRCADCNVLLISIDTLRANHLSLYGGVRATSPNIDRFAQDGITFDNSIDTGGGTLPVHMSMFTSLPLRVHGVNSGDPRPLAAARVTLPMQLKAAG